MNCQLELAGKRVELLREAFPSAHRVGLLWDSASEEQAVAAAAVAGKLGFEPRLLELIGQPPNYAAALIPMDQSPGQRVMIPASPLALRDRVTIAHLLLKRGTPSICAFREVMEAGALMSYGVNLVDVFRDIAAFVDQVIKGGKAGDIPMEGAVTFPHRVQSQDGQSVRPRNACDVARPRRRGDRVSGQIRRREFITLLGGTTDGGRAPTLQARC